MVRATICYFLFNLCGRGLWFFIGGVLGRGRFGCLRGFGCRGLGLRLFLWLVLLVLGFVFLVDRYLFLLLFLRV